MVCKSCNGEFDGPYCHHCGQKFIERFSFRYLVGWFNDEIMVFDKGFIFSIKELFLHPEKISRNYIGGSTKKYLNPYKFLLIFSAGVVIAFSFIPDFKMLSGNSELLKNWPGVFTVVSIRYFMENLPLFIFTNLLAYFLISIPFWALFSYLLFKKIQLNYFEHLIYISYLSAYYIFVVLVIGLLGALLNKAGGSDAAIVVTTVTIMAIVLFRIIRSIKKFYEETYFKVGLKSILMLYGGLLLSMVIQFLTLSIIKSVLI